MKSIVLYTMNGCPHCVELKKLLVKENIKFVDRDIDENKEEYDLFVKLTESEFVPAFMLCGDDYRDTEFFVPDKSFKNIHEAVDLIKERIL